MVVVVGVRYSLLSLRERPYAVEEQQSGCGGQLINGVGCFPVEMKC